MHGLIVLLKIYTSETIADILTILVAREKVVWAKASLGLVAT
jgi:hypothetical protein